MLDLTPFDFTPTESLIYEVLVTKGPGTGYAVARAAGLARANAYAALEGLVGKGAARADDGPPKRYRPEPPAVLLGRIVDRQSQAIDQLARTMEQIATPATTTLVEVTSLRSVGQLLTLEIARARTSVSAFLPASAWPMLVPSVR
ncbi:MAG TPA: helix-turn-helix domain-containing protein, partial [Gemmatimonadales bacterium]|nr:helix-turn-helix domain-containing protein [Gemmatimonadales bacterium]